MAWKLCKSYCLRELAVGIPEPPLQVGCLKTPVGALQSSVRTALRDHGLPVAPACRSESPFTSSSTEEPLNYVALRVTSVHGAVCTINGSGELSWLRASQQIYAGDVSCKADGNIITIKGKKII